METLRFIRSIFSGEEEQPLQVSKSQLLDSLANDKAVKKYEGDTYWSRALEDGYSMMLL
jgi:hypothetical protein